MPIQQEKIMQLKAELFDLQVELGIVKQKIMEKLRELNDQLKKSEQGEKNGVN
jgi:hypothetical protein